MIRLYMRDLSLVHMEILEGYLSYLDEDDRCYKMIEHFKKEGGTMPPDKQGRWVGFIQAHLIQLGHTTVDAERDATRPKFRALYTRYNLPRATQHV